MAQRAGLKLPASLSLRVVERIPGTGSTEFGVPGELSAADSKKMTAAAGKRLAALVEAAWQTFADVAAHAPAELRKGPRGGGRDRDKIVEHVLGAEDGYGRMLGVRVGDDERRPAILEAIRRGQTRDKGWTPRYAARRIAWHALDHAWEIEDRST